MFERGLFPLLIKLGEPVYGYPFSGYWLDMGNPEKYLSLNCDLLLSKTRSPLVDVSKDRIYCDRDVAIHPSANIKAPAIIGSRCQISQRVYIKGPVVIGPDCHIEEGASIENGVLWDNVRIGANARLSHCIIGSHTSIEPNNQVSDCVVIPSESVSLSQ
jgi:mannose-1-phosphate guanylyltransferase